MSAQALTINVSTGTDDKCQHYLFEKQSLKTSNFEIFIHCRVMKLADMPSYLGGEEFGTKPGKPTIICKAVYRDYLV
jgi:hypothetical protein